MDMQEINHINFDWYMPLNCHRMMVDEVKLMCHDSGLTTQHVHGSDITVVAAKD
jgi:arsenite methyltransferase